MVGHLASPKPLHIARWGSKGALMGCTSRTTGPTGTLPLLTADQTHTHTHILLSVSGSRYFVGTGLCSLRMLTEIFIVVEGLKYVAIFVNLVSV